MKQIGNVLKANEKFLQNNQIITACGIKVYLYEMMMDKSTQNNKFASPLQYLKENVKDEVDFLPADNHQSFLLIDTIILGVCCQAFPNYPK